jgi:hypothetical protein
MAMPVLSGSQPINIQQETIEPLMTASKEAAHPSDVTVAYTLDELLSYHDLHFVLCAFQTLLGRAPDPEGLNYYLGRVRTGHSKIQILKQLRRSPESFLRGAYQTLLGRDPDPEGREHFLRQLSKGISKKRIAQQLRRSPEGTALRRLRKGKARATVFPGLDKAIRHYQRGQLPLVGWLFRLAYGTESDHPTERKLRAIENQLFMLGNESNSRFNQMEIALSGLHSLITQQTQTLVAAMGGEAAPPPPKQPPEPEGLDKLTRAGRDIYFKLRAATTANAVKL